MYNSPQIIYQDIIKSLTKSKYAIITFILSIIIVNFFIYFLGLPDDRGNIVQSLSKGWVIGDFPSYQIPFLHLFKDFLIGRANESSAVKIGPLFPFLIFILKANITTLGNLLLKIIGLMLGIVNIILIQKIIPNIFTDIEGLNSFKSINIFGKRIKINPLDYSCILGFSLNPIILYYFAFPSTDSLYSTTFFIILLLSIDLVKSFRVSEKISFSDTRNIWIISITLFVGMLIRTTAILNYFVIIIPACLILKSSLKYWRKLILPLILNIYIIITSSIYYLPYANLSHNQNIEWSNGISLWQTPLANKNWQTNKVNNFMAHSLSFPFKFSELSGLRPSYMTTIDSKPRVTEKSMILSSSKPYLYIYIRSNWAFFIIIPSFIMFIINIISNPSLEKLVLLISILSVPLLFTYSIVLERYFLHCSSLLACMFLPLINQIRISLKKYST